MRNLVLILTSVASLGIAPLALTGVALTATPAFAGCGEPGTAGSNNPACHHKQQNRDWVRGTDHQCWWDNKAHTIESCSES
jgi:hypothetical protein